MSLQAARRLATVREVADTLKMSDWAVYDWLKRHQGLQVRIGRRIRVDLDRLEAHLAAGGDR